MFEVVPLTKSSPSWRIRTQVSLNACTHQYLLTSRERDVPCSLDMSGKASFAGNMMFRREGLDRGEDVRRGRCAVSVRQTLMYRCQGARYSSTRLAFCTPLTQSFRCASHRRSYDPLTKTFSLMCRHGTGHLNGLEENPTRGAARHGDARLDQRSAPLYVSFSGRLATSCAVPARIFGHSPNDRPGVVFISYLTGVCSLSSALARLSPAIGDRCSTCLLNPNCRSQPFTLGYRLKPNR